MAEHEIDAVAGAGSTPSPTHGTGAGEHPDVDRQVRAALYVFGSLLVLTGFTVGAYFLHLPLRTAIALALAIATVKGTLVAAWFMHLISEKKLIYWMLLLAAAFFVPLLLLPTFGMLDAVSLR
ncbi:MAG: cytochrome C oxidase subunit IV family protein [Betaproteobacteria bacterium]|jgi:cytochrome c oxidase subunit 4